MRQVALAIIRKKEKYLVEKYKDDISGTYFYKFMGGGIEEGETPQKALEREIREELKSEIISISEPQICEDEFTYLGIKREIKAFLMEAEFKNEDDYDFSQKLVYSPEGKFLSIAMWKSIEEIKAEGLELYPRPMAEKLK